MAYLPGRERGAGLERMPPEASPGWLQKQEAAQQLLRGCQAAGDEHPPCPAAGTVRVTAGWNGALHWNLTRGSRGEALLYCKLPRVAALVRYGAQKPNSSQRARQEPAAFLAQLKRRAPLALPWKEVPA